VAVKDFNSTKDAVKALLQTVNTRQPAQIKNDLKNRSRVLFKFSKLHESAFFAHQDIWRLLGYAFFRSGLPLEYTQGFTPLVHLEITEPLPLGSSSCEEYGIIYLNAESGSVLSDLDDVLVSINSYLPESVRILQLDVLPVIDGRKNFSLSAVHWGSVFELSLIDCAKSAADFLKALKTIQENNPEILKDLTAAPSEAGLLVTLPFSGKKEFGIQGLILQILGVPFRESGLSIRRKNQYAKNPDSGNAVDYYAIYR